MLLTKIQNKFPNLDFSKFVYKNAPSKSTVICPTHGEFEQSYLYFYKLKNSVGCPLCLGRVSTQASFETKLNRVYSAENRKGVKAEYLSCEEVKVTCETHGEFIRSPEVLFRPEHGLTPCPQCNQIVKRPRPPYGQELQKRTARKYLDKVKEKFEGRIDTTQIEYIDAVTPVKVVCTLHGPVGRKFPHALLEYEETPCKICNKPDLKRTTEDYLSTLEHPEEFLSEKYLGYTVKHSYRCATHGEYRITPAAYHAGRRCQKCSLAKVSKLEKEVLEFCCTLGVPVAENVTFPNRKDADILFPLHNLAIEFHGLYFHSEKFRGRKDAQERADYFLSIEVKLLQVFEDEWVSSRGKVEDRIRSALGLLPKVSARECEVKSIPLKEAFTFLQEVHMQGGLKTSSYAYALFYKGDMVSVATFGSPRAAADIALGFLEIHRFASTIQVVGGFSKMLTLFEKEVKPYRLLSYADRRWGEGDVYGLCGFQKVGVTTPGYFWSKGQKRESRWKFQKSLLTSWDNYSPEKTEDQILTEKSYVKVYDAGHSRWEKHY